MLKVIKDYGQFNFSTHRHLFDLQQAKTRIGYVAQQFAPYPEHTAKENLSFYSSMHDNFGNEQEKLLDLYDLPQFSAHFAGQLSGL